MNATAKLGALMLAALVAVAIFIIFYVAIASWAAAAGCTDCITLSGRANSAAFRVKVVG